MRRPLSLALIAVAVVHRAADAQAAPESGTDLRMHDAYARRGYSTLRFVQKTTVVTMLVGRKPRQVEDYADWKVGVDLGAEMFQVTSWVPAKHWAVR